MTSAGEPFPAGIVIWTAGFAVPDLARRSGLAVDDHGRALVGESMRSVSHSRVFGAGDASSPVAPVGVDTVRASAYTSIIMGAHAGANAARELKGKDPKPLRFGYLQQAISLGRGDGLVQLTDGHDKPYGWVIEGRLATRMKELIERFLVVGGLRLERRMPNVYAWPPAPRAPNKKP